VAPDAAVDALGHELLVGYGELVITGIDAEMTALLFLHPSPIQPDVPTRPRVTPTRWRRHTGPDHLDRAARHPVATESAGEEFAPLPRSAWKLVEDLEQMLARYPACELEVTADDASLVYEGVGA
jgi:hypothetical protein